MEASPRALGAMETTAEREIVNQLACLTVLGLVWSLSLATPAYSWGKDARTRAVILFAMSSHVRTSCKHLTVDEAVLWASIEANGVSLDDLKAPGMMQEATDWLVMLRKTPQPSCGSAITMFGPQGRAVSGIFRVR